MQDQNKIFTDHRGTLVVNSIPKHFPSFPVRRFFLITANESKTRGHHAHKTCWQIIIVISGRWRINIDTLGGRKICEHNPTPAEFYVIEPGTWVVMEALSENSQMLVLCDKEYDPEDYIHSREEFEKMVKERR